MEKSNKFSLAKQLIEEEYYLDAIKILKKLHKTNPKSRPIKYELAAAWVLSGISIDRGEKYLEKLKDEDDHVARLAKMALGRILLCKKDYEGARLEFESLMDHKIFKTFALSELLYLNVRENNNQEADEIYRIILEENPDYWLPKVRTQIETYLGYKLGRITDIEKCKGYYFGKQLMDYSEDRAIEHIKLHLEENEYKEQHSLYLDTVDIEELYHNSKIKITNINPTYVGITDKYTLEIGKPIGVVAHETVDNVEVITLPNTYNVLAMYPTYNYKTRVKK